MGSWFNNDGLYIQYGVTKAVPETGGDFLQLGDARMAEFTIDLTTLTTTPVIQSQTTFIGAAVFIEQVDIDVEVAAVGGTSVSVGLMSTDRSTVTSNTGFVNAIVTASLTQGAKISLTGGSTGAGGYIGTTTPSMGYLTSLAAGTFSAGRIKVRIRYRGYGTITQ